MIVVLAIFVLLALSAIPSVAEVRGASPGNPTPNATIDRQLAKDLEIILNTLDNHSPCLEKKQSSELNRLIFIAGLEGTGHHGARAVFNVCVKKKLCKVDYPITDQIMRYDWKTDILHGLFGAADVNLNAVEAVNVLRSMRRTAGQGGSNLNFLGLCYATRSGMLSYPNFNGKHKTLDHPDLHMIATLAEAAGLDFRVLVLQRDADEVLRSNSRRGYGGSLGPKVLIANAEALQAELALVDPRFFRCVQYRSLGVLSAEGRRQLADFLHPTLLQPQLMDEMLSKFKYTGNTDALASRRLQVQGQEAASKGVDSNRADMGEQIGAPTIMRRKERLEKVRASRAAVMHSSRNSSEIQSSPAARMQRREARKRLSADEQLGVAAAPNEQARVLAAQYHARQLRKRLQLIDQQCARAQPLL